MEPTEPRPGRLRIDPQAVDRFAAREIHARRVTATAASTRQVSLRRSRPAGRHRRFRPPPSNRRLAGRWCATTHTTATAPPTVGAPTASRSRFPATRRSHCHHDTGTRHRPCNEDIAADGRSAVGRMLFAEYRFWAPRRRMRWDGWQWGSGSECHQHRRVNEVGTGRLSCTNPFTTVHCGALPLPFTQPHLPMP